MPHLHIIPEASPYRKAADFKIELTPNLLLDRYQNWYISASTFFAAEFLVACTRLYNLLYPSVGRLVKLYFFYDFISFTSLLLPKWSGDLKHGPCPPARDFSSRVSGLVNRPCAIYSDHFRPQFPQRKKKNMARQTVMHSNEKMVSKARKTV